MKLDRCIQTFGRNRLTIDVDEYPDGGDKRFLLQDDGYQPE
jgi:hypothetical protein